MLLKSIFNFNTIKRYYNSKSIDIIKYKKVLNTVVKYEFKKNKILNSIRQKDIKQIKIEMHESHSNKPFIINK